jgi:hypothetical protein
MPAVAQPSITSNNGVLGFNLNSYGRLRIGTFPYSTNARQVDRMSFIAALSQNAVYDYIEDADTTRIFTQRTKINNVDSAFICVTDNGFSKKPPKIRVLHTLYSWQNTPYFIIRYRVKNDSLATLQLYLGVAILTRPSGTYGGETIAYNSDKNTGYYFRTGQNPHWGVRLLNKPTSSVKIRDWDNYSSNPASEVATDSTRYAMTAIPGFDAAKTVGPNSGIYHVNAGVHNIAPKDSADVYYAIAFGNSLSEMLAASDAAQARYNSLRTSVEEPILSTPGDFVLYQNYPNPFNPSTEIRFVLTEKSLVNLTVYDAVGREIKTLLNGTLIAGSHIVTFNATGLTSGIYIYTLRTSRFSVTRKMLLMR